VLKNPFALSCAPGSGIEYAAFVVHWPCFRALLDHRPVRQPLFQQCTMALAGPPRRDENKEEVVALVRRRLCLVQPKPVHASVTQERSPHSAGAPRVLFLPLRAEEILVSVLCAHDRFHEFTPCFRGARSSPPGFSSADPEAVADGSNPLTINHTARTISCRANGRFRVA
jgi:hypothetical protein